MLAKILVVEDDATVNQLLCEKLRQSEFDVDSAFNGLDGLLQAKSSQYHLILLDVMMPEMDGFEFLAELRKEKQTPVLVLTACGGEEDRIQGFKTGADDYLIKPFNMTELHLRVEAILKRTSPELFNTAANSSNQQFFQFNKQTMDVDVNTPDGNIHKLILTLIEYDLLKTLAEQADDVLTKAYLYQNVLRREFSRYDRTLDMHISKIRKKFVTAGLGVNLIKTVRGQGYCLDLSKL